MKCPKCGFTSFDHLDACRKCGGDVTGHRARFGLRGLPGVAPSTVSPAAAPALPAAEEPVEAQRPGPRRLLALLRRDRVPQADLSELATDPTPEEPFSLAPDLSQVADPIDMRPDEALPPDSCAPATAAGGVPLAPAPPPEPLPAAVLADGKVPVPEPKPLVSRALNPSPDLPLFELLADNLQEAAVARPEPLETADPFEQADFSGLFADSEPGSVAAPDDAPPAGEGLPELEIAASLLEDSWSISELPPLPEVAPVAPPTTVADLPLLDEAPLLEQNDATEPEGTAAVERPPVAPRLVAALVDLAILGAVFALFVAAGQAALAPQPGALLASLLALSTPYFLVLFALCFGYFTLFHFLSGQTPGKMLARLRVEGEGGTSLLLSQAFLRSVGGLLCLLPLGLGYLRIVFDRKRHGWNDRLAGTHVAHLSAGPTRND